MKNIICLFLFSLALLCAGCTDYLDEKSDSRLTIPDTLEDNQALLDRLFILGLNAASGEISSDDIYVTDADFTTMPAESEKRLYTWQPDYVAVPGDNDWANCFRRINTFNTVLFNLDHYNISGSENVRGQALVLRAAAYLEAAQIWCLAYDAATAASNQGLPLRLDPGINTPSVRANLQETYAQIVSDLKTAVPLLPPQQVAASRPSKATALGYLARAYLFMGDYENALAYGLQSLAVYNVLLDYNTLSPTASYPIKGMNAEILLPTSMAYSPFLSSTKAKIPLSLYNSYAANDLRKVIFFKKNAANEILFKGNYTGGASRSTGLATDEVYLMVAESYAHQNDISKAMQVLNQLLVMRWKTGTFVPLTASAKDEALQVIRTERRKELLLRGLRWTDLKRYNREGAGINLTRTIDGTIYSLPANDLRYAIALPEDIIAMTGMPQNPR